MRPIKLFTLVAILVTGCAVSPAPTPTATATYPPVATSTQPATATVTPTSTGTSTPTVVPSATPSTTPTSSPTVKPSPRPTVKPTRVPSTPTPTPAATRAGVQVPGPQIEPFDAGGFIDYLNRAHTSFQTFLSGFGNLVAHGITGSCQWYNQVRNDWLGMIGFSDVPEAWQSPYSEYRSLINGAFQVTEPIHSICQAGGGSIDDATDRQIIDFFDAGQNRLYQMIQEAKTK